LHGLLGRRLRGCRRLFLRLLGLLRHGAAGRETGQPQGEGETGKLQIGFRTSAGESREFNRG